jgi:hypothetical protein
MVVAMMRPTKRRRRRPNANGRRRLRRPKIEEKKNIVRWKKSVKRCVKKLGIK